ncbi:hypothetical protein Vadar_026623 [Vaccinium darrowii]|uniref:Uncharacterized protein n=1 Tax=Vaccinium darrowii TaxID=229202 RepID=A0ACB7Z7W1_9ERIC|nr:hypothetical protein Vadar_026623 [Vaccinium darrowii]
MLMENFLRSKEYWPLVETGFVEPEKDAVLTEAQKTKHEELKLKDLKAKNYLFQAIDHTILETILTKDTLKQIWDAMKQKYRGNAKRINQHEVVEQALQLQHSINNPSLQQKGCGRGKGGSSSNNKDQGKGRERDDQHGGDQESKSFGKSKVKCFRCNRYGHFRSECRTKMQKGKGAKSHFAEKEDEISLLRACNVAEETRQSMWYLDIGSSNHMCGNKSIFSELDESYRSSAKFGDGSTISVMGKGSVQIPTSKNAHPTISSVFYVLDKMWVEAANNSIPHIPMSLDDDKEESHPQPIVGDQPTGVQQPFDPSSSSEAAAIPEEDNSASLTMSRPERSKRRPAWMQDYVHVHLKQFG